MSIQSEIERIRGNVQDSLDVCRDAGVSVASDANSNALPSAVAELARSVGGVSLPPGYIQVEYLQSTGTQYINTGVLYGPDNYRNMRIVADSIVGTAANGWAVSGVGAGTTFYYGCGNSSRTMYYGNGSQDISSGADYTGNRAIWDINHQDAYYRVAEKASGKVLVDIGITLSTPTAGSHPLYLFAYRWTPGPSYDATCHNETIYGCKIYEGDALARNFVPCVNTSGAAGLYDLVNGVFYGNAGSGTFITGPVVGVTPIEKGGTGATDAATARNNLGITPQNIDALPLAGGNMTGAGPVQYPVVGDPGRSQHYISAGGGYSANSGKYGVKLVCCDQPDCQTGMGQDLTGLPNGYELSIAGGRNANGDTGYISFAMHSVNSKVYDRLGYFDNGGNFYTKGQITEGGTPLATKYAGKNEIPTDYLPKSGGTIDGSLDFSNRSGWITPYLLAFKNADPNSSPTYPNTGFYQWGDMWEVSARDANNSWKKTVFSIDLPTSVANFGARPTVNGSGLALQSEILPNTGGKMTGHLYMAGANEGSSTGSTSQIVFGTPSDNHVVLSSNRGALIVNPTTASTSNQIVLYLNQASDFPNGIRIGSAGQNPSDFLLRNSKLVSSDTNPTVNGEICWTYK